MIINNSYNSTIVALTPLTAASYWVAGLLQGNTTIQYYSTKGKCNSTLGEITVSIASLCQVKLSPHVIIVNTGRTVEYTIGVQDAGINVTVSIDVLHDNNYEIYPYYTTDATLPVQFNITGVRASSTYLMLTVDPANNYQCISKYNIYIYIYDNEYYIMIIIYMHNISIPFSHFQRLRIFFSSYSFKFTFTH